MNTLRLEIVTPEGLIFSDNIKYASFPGIDGEFGVLAGHASLISELKAGIIEIELNDSNKEVIAINWGYVKVDEHKTSVLADGAIAITGDTESKIAASLQEAKKLIESMGDSNVDVAMARVDSLTRKRF